MENFHIFYVKVELWILRSILVSSCKHAEEEVAALVVYMAVAAFYWFAGEIAPRAVFPTIAMKACTR